ncbi:hypothetical protein Poli38472_013818 [Pythium oligandrum]|uniref:THH1/TOM1/TOM3 domain-containing protein n=1 Tax=Pythium oligandrum TaxID=41045 RepID=A0A8K1C256_PYTOL|nr:hypothetical protein Poli38472_013818 [Pythium oligandrum]|eukprot:TMW55056.1 hypothetical protein Poli38472_013818 [Pythium oligandrum]
MPLFLANLAMASYFLALCYMLVTVVTFMKLMEVRRVLRQHQRTGWNTTQLLILSVALGCLFRTATFSTLCIFDSQTATEGVYAPSPRDGDYPGHLRSAHQPTRLEGDQHDLDFYNKVVAVLFNLPDFLFVSSYLLLVLVWAEVFQSSRRHWFSAEDFRRRWMIFYLIFNGSLYVTQIILYTSLFLSDQHNIFRDDQPNRLNVIPEMIFYVVAATDLFLPLIILSTWVYLTLSLSGFPFKSDSARLRLGRVGRLVMAWSIGRILYSVMTLLTFTKGWFNVERRNVSAQSMLLVAVFFVAELMPVYLTLDARLLVMLSVEEYQPLIEDAWLECVNQWEGKIKRVINASRDAFHQEKFALQLHLETTPAPFQPSAVLAQLIQKENRRDRSGTASQRQQKQSLKNVEYLERKLESEIHQHCELEGEQACAKWKQMHLHLCANQRELLDRIEREYQRFCAELDVAYDSYDTTEQENTQDVDSNQVDNNDLRLQLYQESEWIQQERFNIQEAFTNQSKKIQADFQSFIDQLDAEFGAERQKILQQQQQVSSAIRSPQQHQRRKVTLDRQFKSNTKRHMLVQTAPVVELHTNTGQSSSFLQRSDTANKPVSGPATSDVTAVQRQIQELQERLASFKEAAETRRKEGMQWIGRQCAHMFAQLDCKENEAKLVHLLTKENATATHKLTSRMTDAAYVG